MLAVREIFPLVLLKPGPMKGTVYSSRKILQPLRRASAVRFLLVELGSKEKSRISQNQVNQQNEVSVAKGFPVQVF